MPPRPIVLSLALILITIAAGLAIRFAPIGLPSIVTKYGGSILWALTIYWIVSTLLPSTHLIQVALLTGALTAAIELFKLYHSPALDAFRLTLPGALLLGRFSSIADIAAYWLAIFVGVFVDKAIRTARHGISP